MLQAMKDDPPLSTKCKDKFLIQSTLITPEKESLPLQDIWAPSEGGEVAAVHQQKLRVVYLPAEGQVLEEEEEPAYEPLKPAHAREPSPPPAPSDLGASRFDTAHPNGHSAHHAPIPEFEESQHSTIVPPPPSQQIVDAEPEHHTPSPPADDFHEDDSHAVGYTSIQSDLHDDRPATPEQVLPPAQTRAVAPAPAASLPPPVPSVPAREFEELETKYRSAQAEIERLRAQLAAPQPELRRRTRALSDVGSDSGSTAVGTLIMDDNMNQEGVPLQVVVIIALGVFVTTYLFF
ncbi:hypothetical protein HGRIS_006362 [Hohenbuehelia grisea]|uniref:MSP domain-containing protein n=1 Tax=Hohenbuehelia grisea TaxID=104357 RepID=A0ABR3JZN7_9AGAR